MGQCGKVTEQARLALLEHVFDPISLGSRSHWWLGAVRFDLGTPEAASVGRAAGPHAHLMSCPKAMKGANLAGQLTAASTPSKNRTASVV